MNLCYFLLLLGVTLSSVLGYSSSGSNDVLSMMMKKPFSLKTDKDNRVSGGESDYSNDYGFQVQLKELGEHVCGAVLLNDSWAITAAHCVIGRNPARLSVETGGNSIRSLDKVVIHDQFIPATMANNLALLHLGQTTFLSNDKKAVRASTIVHLPEPGQKFTDMVTFVGYGSISNRVPRTDGEKRIVSLPMASLSRCRSLYGQGFINSGQLCAGNSYTGAGLCQGDSGSGLTQADGDDVEEEGTPVRQILVGIGSFGFDCGNGRYPSVFTAVADYVAWIKETTGSA